MFKEKKHKIFVSTL